MYFLMLLQSQYIVLEKKYSKAKKLLREFQQREQDLLHREEFYLQLLQEKDTEYNALVKTLKDRVSYCYLMCGSAMLSGQFALSLVAL
jgi:neurabin